jgi:cell division protein FtsB
MNPKILTRTLMASALLSFAGIAGAAPDAELAQKIDALAQQIETLKAQLQQLKAQNEALAAQQEQQAQQSAQTQPAAKTSALDDVSLWGYGEVYYDRPIHDTAKTTADLARAVFGIGYRFDDRTRFNSEYEIEHAVSSADDPGEVEVEQFYVDRQLTNWAAVKGGLILIPSGLINLSHEPTRFYGVRRNFVETLIIPSTWREGGFAFHGDTDFGLGWDAGLTTGFNLSKWEINPSEPLGLEDAAPLQATHQELALANASHLSQYLALGYNGVPGLNVGASVFTGVATPFDASLSDERVTLWETHTRWTPWRFDLSALYSRGTISNTADANRLFPGASNPIPASFFGYYLQGAVTAWQQDDYRLAPFVRWERFNIGSSYQAIVPGYPDRLPTERVWSYGANFYVNPHVVLKADYQSFEVNRDMDRIDLGLGLDF